MMMLSTLLLVSMLNYAVGDISEKLKQGQGLNGPGPSSQFGGLLAPFPGQPQNNFGGRFSAAKGGNPNGVNGGNALLSSGTSNPNSRVPIPFHNHDGDDDENNLDRLCNDAFHSFLCKPVGPRRNRIDGNLRPGARIPPGVFVGSSSNVQEFKEPPQQSGGALLPTSIDENEDGYRYPKPTNNVPTITGYSYPKPPYTYEKPTNQLAYPSQVSESIQKPSNEYLPSFQSTMPPPTTTTLPPPTTVFNFANTSPKLSPFTAITPSVTRVPAQTNIRPVVLNQVSYQYQQPINPIPFSSPTQHIPILTQPATTYSFPQATVTATHSVPLVTASPAINTISYSTSKAPTHQLSNQFPLYTAPTISQPILYTGYQSNAVRYTPLASIQSSSLSNTGGYYYPNPSNVDPVAVSTVPQPVPQPSTLAPNNGYLPPIGAPVPQEVISDFGGLPPAKINPLFIRFQTPAIPTTQRPVSIQSFQTSTLQPINSPARPISYQASTIQPFTSPPRAVSIQASTIRPFTFPSQQSTTLPPQTFRTTTYRPTTLISSPIPTTIRPFTLRTPAPLVSVTTLRPFTYQASSTTPAPTFFNSFQRNPALPGPPQAGPSNGYLPPPNQPIPSPANTFNSILPAELPSTTARPTFIRLTTTTTPAPTPSKEYLPQIDIRASSTNLSPNLSGGSILAAEADAPTPDIKSPNKHHEKEHTIEEFCRDAFHSFLCKPIDKPRRRIDGKIREGAKIPPHVLIGANSLTVGKKIAQNQVGGGLLPAEQPAQYNPYRPIGSNFQSTNLSPQIAPPINQPLFLLSASDSSSLAKQFSRFTTQNVPNPNALPHEQATSNPQETVAVKSTPIPQIFSTRQFPTTTAQPSTSTARYIEPKQNYETTADSSQALPDSVIRSNPKSRKSPSNIEGYRYPKPSKPFATPTSAPKQEITKSEKPYKIQTPAPSNDNPKTAKPLTTHTSSTGYDYPKPAKPFTFPAFRKPSIPKLPTATNSQQTFGQRLRPTVQPTQQVNEQAFQTQTKVDPFSQKEAYDADNELPPASQFEILKP